MATVVQQWLICIFALILLIWFQQSKQFFFFGPPIMEWSFPASQIVGLWFHVYHVFWLKELTAPNHYVVDNLQCWISSSTLAVYKLSIHYTAASGSTNAAAGQRMTCVRARHCTSVSDFFLLIWLPIDYHHHWLYTGKCRCMCVWDFAIICGHSWRWWWRWSWSKINHTAQLAFLLPIKSIDYIWPVPPSL